MVNPKISIIIPVYNGEKYIAQAIESVLAQTYKNFEIIIINDGSTDNSLEKIKPYLSLPNIKYIEQHNKGVAAARNTGIVNYAGELIALLDQDDLWLSEKLKVQVDYLAKNTDVGLVHSNFAYIDKKGKQIYPTDAWITDAKGMCFKRLFIGNAIAPLTVIMKRECMDRVGLFDEEISYCDDYELWLRIARHFRIGHIDQILALYRLHGSNASGRDWVGMKLKKLEAINGFLRKFPEVRSELGWTTVRLRLARLHRDLASAYLLTNQPEKARMHFRESIRLKPDQISCYLKFLYSCLSHSQLRALRWYKYRTIETYNRLTNRQKNGDSAT